MSETYVLVQHTYRLLPTAYCLLPPAHCQLPAAGVLAHPLGFGPTGVFIAVSVGFSTLAVVSAWLFRKGTWKVKRV